MSPARQAISSLIQCILICSTVSFLIKHLINRRLAHFPLAWQSGHALQNLVILWLIEEWSWRTRVSSKIVMEEHEHNWLEYIKKSTHYNVASMWILEKNLLQHFHKFALAFIWWYEYEYMNDIKDKDTFSFSLIHIKTCHQRICIQKTLKQLCTPTFMEKYLFITVHTLNSPSLPLQPSGSTLVNALHLSIVTPIHHTGSFACTTSPNTSMPYLDI